MRIETKKKLLFFFFSLPFYHYCITVVTLSLTLVAHQPILAAYKA